MAKDEERTEAVLAVRLRMELCLGSKLLSLWEKFAELDRPSGMESRLGLAALFRREALEEREGGADAEDLLDRWEDWDL